MLRRLSESDSSFSASVSTNESVEKLGELVLDSEADHLQTVQDEVIDAAKCISVGDSLPYGPRMYYETCENVVRMKDIGEKNRILLIGVLGSFTPDCWNRHLFRVLNKLRYYDERDIDYICCIATNDAFTQRAWGVFLGCEDSVLMWSDATGRFTKALGMNVVVPWLDNTIRSKRYVILAEDMIVTKMIKAPNDSPNMRWDCGHFLEEEIDEEVSDESWI